VAPSLAGGAEEGAGDKEPAAIPGPVSKFIEF